jgi:hypothetical protein
MGMLCRRCQQIKLLSEFPADRRRRNGLFVYCKECCTANTKSYHNEAQTTPEGRARNRRKRWLAMLRSHGMTEAGYLSLLEAQGGVCAICRGPETFRTKDGRDIRPLCVDHDHATGAVRGLLCHSCNVAIGHFRDNPVTLLAAINYLQPGLDAISSGAAA